MTPAERLAIGVDTINSYLYSITMAFADYTRLVANEFSESANKHDLELLKIRLIILESMITMVTTYLTETVSGDENICSIVEIEKTMRHINEICDTNYWLILN
jgi:hypothetical protein